ncbi:MAG: hypothetical protein MZU91_13440 [Desulfosudis oleivorans]|nr:hypothetical protein [Desulfosudis oleivorans]
MEIWEIALYNERGSRQSSRRHTHGGSRSWRSMISHHIEDKVFARNVSIAMVALWEGMAPVLDHLPARVPGYRRGAQGISAQDHRDPAMPRHEISSSLR